MKSYPLGVFVVGMTLFVSAALCLVIVNPRPDPGPRAEHLEALASTLGPFQLIERSGKTIRETDLEDRTWIAAFVFSRCPSSCPRISKVMKDLQAELKDTKITLASLTVDPDYDKPEILRKFADRYGADPDRWLFLTGEKSALYRLILGGFLQSLSEVPPEERKDDVEAISHSDRLVLVGPGNVILGAYHSSEPGAVARLSSRARSVEKMENARRSGWVLRLPAVNATLNATCSLLLFSGWILIRSGRTKAHILCMTSAITVSALFLGCYLVYHFMVGSVQFQGAGPIRHVYFSILLSHTILAIAVVPMIAVTVILAIRTRFVSHRKIASVTFPIWMYVSITGVLVYLMLYRMPLPSPPV